MDSLIQPQRRKLGAFEVGPLGFGTWRLVAMSAADAQEKLEAALSAGMNLVDTADVYGLDWGGAGFGASEQLLGEVMRTAPELRSRMVLASKGGIVPGTPYNSARLKEACEASLQRLGVERIDLYQIHRPDLLTHPAEVARVLEDLRADGKIAEVGVSNFSPSQTAALMAHLPFPLASQQPEYSALHLAPLFDGVFDQCMAHGQTPLVWSPLAGGRLTQESEVPGALLEVLKGLASREEVPVATLALAFALAHPAKPVALVGSTSVQRIQAAARALTVTLDRADTYQIIQASMGEALP